MDALKMAYVPYNLYIKISFLDKSEFNDKHNQNNLKYEKHLKCIQDVILS